MAQKKNIGVGDKAFFYEIDPFGDGDVWEGRVTTVTKEHSYVLIVNAKPIYVPEAHIFDSEIKARHALRKALIKILEQRLDRLHSRIEDLEHGMTLIRKVLRNVLAKMKEL